MASNPVPASPRAPAVEPRHPTGPGVLLSSADYAALLDELESLRAAARGELPQRACADGADGADLLAALVTTGVDEQRIAQVAALVELASIVDDAAVVSNAAGLGSIVKVEDRAGQMTEYELVGLTDQKPPPERVALASATGKALLGARPGDVLRIELPNGRQRRVRVTNVTRVPALGRCEGRVTTT